MIYGKSQHSGILQISSHGKWAYAQHSKTLSALSQHFINSYQYIYIYIYIYIYPIFIHSARVLRFSLVAKARKYFYLFSPTQ